MNRTTLGRFDILMDADLYVAVFNLQSNTRLRLSFSAPDLAMITTVASELGRNILKYGGGRGYLLVTWIEDPARGNNALEIKAVDYGPGFADVESALKDHYSTGGTLGLGLSGAARIMDSLEIESQPGQGATVTAQKWAKPDAGENRGRLVLERIEAAKYVRPCDGETLSGDAALVERRADKGMLVAVIDVLGHGPDAHQVAVQLSARLLNWLPGAPAPSPEGALALLHAAAQGTRGAVAAVAWLDGRSLRGSVAGIGNVRCRLFGSVTKTVEFEEGVLGSRMRSLRPTAFVLQPGDVFLLFSDGITDRFSVNEYPTLTLDPAPTIAFNIVRRFGKGHDDASCVVLRCRW